MKVQSILQCSEKSMDGIKRTRTIDVTSPVVRAVVQGDATAMAFLQVASHIAGKN
jgi:hypothetical protein